MKKNQNIETKMFAEILLLVCYRLYYFIIMSVPVRGGKMGICARKTKM